jgi:hypothetical protein
MPAAWLLLPDIVCLWPLLRLATAAWPPPPGCWHCCSRSRLHARFRRLLCTIVRRVCGAPVHSVGRLGASQTSQTALMLLLRWLSAVLTMLLAHVKAAFASDNGRAITPPRGWRSWWAACAAAAPAACALLLLLLPPSTICPPALLRGRPHWKVLDFFRNQYQARINQTIMESNMRGLASRHRPGGRSLADLGYTDAGLDDGWQLCNPRPTSTNPHAFHTPAGAPIVDTLIFPDFVAMNKLAHSLNLTSGWCGARRDSLPRSCPSVRTHARAPSLSCCPAFGRYGNNCNCGPTARNGCSEGDHNGCTGVECYAGDVNAAMVGHVQPLHPHLEHAAPPR